nr:DUF4489 domain-containing protein [uncultured Clostridium sp.]
MSLLSPNHFQYDNELCKQGSVILKCVSTGTVTIPVGTSNTQITIINLPLNISALCNQIIKIEFACNITLIEPQTDSILLMFQINRHCNNMIQKIPIGQRWIFSNISNFVSTGTFSFFVCDCDFNTEECCTYTVDVTPLVTTSGAIISNSILSATAVYQSQCC